MYPEDPDTFGLVPEDWYFPSERNAVCFYGGDAIKATLLEADPATKPFLYSSVCDMVSQHKTLTAAFGMTPDLAEARAVVGLTPMDLALLCEIPQPIILEWDRGAWPLPAAVAVSICKALRWPFAMLFRSRHDWYPRTKAAMEDGDLELPF